MDGAEVPTIGHTKDYLILEMEEKAYYYVRCTDGHKYFEYSGELEEDDE
jgi:hypothetical protein